jgi:UDP-N-acetylglucosamine--N-acetylmuramyl-(pentapeptide) pyrophosphoryl-undecaprenol N-acetylglucosamine transferase
MTVASALPAFQAESQRHPIVLAAGGTGGHVFPAEALAEALRARGYTLALFTDKRGEAYKGELGQLPTHRISASRISGGWVNRARGALSLIAGAAQSRRLFRALKPSVVVGFGGYPSIPAMWAATGLRIPTVIHEQNALMGRANRLLASRVTAIATSFPEVTGIKPADRAKVVMTGNPVRGAVRALRDTSYVAPGPQEPIRILVTGGSQGASVFATVVPQALERLPDEIRLRLDVSQQARPEDLDGVRAAYAKSGIRAEIAPFFADMAARLAATHLFIGRAGASTIAEIACAGRPAILVPYPHDADDHQTANARALEAVNAAILMPQGEFDADTLASRLKLLLGYPPNLARLAETAKALGTADAAGNLAILVAGLCPARTVLARDEREDCASGARGDGAADGAANCAAVAGGKAVPA